MIDRIKLSEHMYLDEVYDVRTYHYHRLLNRFNALILGIDTNLISSWESVRQFVGVPMSINDWWSIYIKFNGDVDKTDKYIRAKKIDQWSGGRTPQSPWYSKGSMHTIKKDKEGIVLPNSLKAIDSTFKEIKDLYKAQKFVYDNSKTIGITRMEVNVGWLHIDTKPTSVTIRKQFKSELVTFDSDSFEYNWKPKNI